MIREHFFISYSTADAQEFAIKLHDSLEGGHPKYEAWLDKRDLRPAEDWDTQLEEAIRDCGALLFVMSPDSVLDNSVCKLEWSRALSFKKSVIPIYYKDSMLPFRLGNRQYIDFTDFDAGIAQLRNHLAWVNSPAGELKRMKDELLDMQRQLSRSQASEESRIKVAMQDLEERIERQQFLVEHPEEAAKRTEKSIEAAIQRERQPADKAKSGTKFINHPPVAVPGYFQDRVDETKILANFLQDERHRIFHLIGRAGIGKTAITVRLLKHLEAGKLPDDNGDLSVDGIVYLSQVGSRDLKIAHLYPDLCRLLPDEVATELDALYREPKTSTGDKIKALLSHFPPDKRVLVLLDNFEDVVDSDTQSVRDSELDDALKALVDAPPHGVKVLITTRVMANELYLHQSQRQRQHVIGTGLGSPYAEEMLRQMDSDGSLGLKDAPLATLGKIADKVMRYPRALEALVGWLEVDVSTELGDVLEFSEGLLPTNVVEVLVKEAINRLDKTSLQVIQALAIFGRPVTPNAIDTMLQHYNPGIDSEPTLRRLLNWHFTRRETGLYTLHPVDRQYALSLIPRGEESDRFERGTPPFTQIALYHTGADYFKSLRKPDDTWETISDFEFHLAEFDLRCNAGDWDTAADILLEIDLKHLFLWGHYKLMVTLHKRVKGNIANKVTKSRSLVRLGMAYQKIGKISLAIENYEHSLKLVRETNNKNGEAVLLNNLSVAYKILGDKEKLVEQYKQSLKIFREIKHELNESNVLVNLANVFRDMGELQQAISYYQQALIIFRDIDNQESEGKALGNLGNAYRDLGDVQQAIDYNQQALTIARNIGDKGGEGTRLGNLSNAYRDLGDIQQAIDYNQQALAIARSISDKSEESIRLANFGYLMIASDNWLASEQHFVGAIAIADEIGFNQTQHYARWALALLRLHQENLSDAKNIVESALSYDRPDNNHNAHVLHGMITLRQGDNISARQSFENALTACDEMLAKTPELYDVRDAKGLALCGLALLDKDSAKVEEGKAMFREARIKTKDLKGHIGRIQRQFDELAKVDTDGLLAGVREAIAGE